MGAKRDEVNGIGINFFVDGAEIAGYINAAVSPILAMKLVIIQKRVKRIFKK